MDTPQGIGRLTGYARGGGCACKIPPGELEDAVRNGTLEEAFGCGTAAVVSPIGELSVDDVPYVVNGGKIGPITQRLYDELTGIQWGRRPDTFGWTEIVK